MCAHNILMHALRIMVALLRIALTQYVSEQVCERYVGNEFFLSNFVERLIEKWDHTLHSWHVGIELFFG